MPQPADAATYAAERGLLYSAADANPNYPGSIFREWTNRVAVDHIRSTTGRFFDAGEFRYDMPAGKAGPATMRWGFIAVHLDRALPHIVLEARTRDTWFTGGLPLDYGDEQKLTLEGDFNDHFTLYCPPGYETDALYIFAPDLMALLIDETGGKHVEIVGEWLFVYWQLPFGHVWTEQIDQVFRIIDVVGTKAVRQTKAYVNDRPSRINQVSGSSRYMKVFWTTIIVVGVVTVLGFIGAVVFSVLAAANNAP